MARHDSPYEYGDAETEPIGEDPPSRLYDADTVIVEGAVMSYRRYASREE